VLIATTRPAALIIWGSGAISTRHAHHCIQLVLALTGTLRVRQHSRESWRRCGSVFVRPDADHEIDASGLPVLIGFIEVESELGAAVAGHLRSDITLVTKPELARWRRALGDPATLDAVRVECWVRSMLLRDSRPRQMDPRIDRVLHRLREHPLDTASTSLERLAAIARLSPSRFAHVFSESLGIPLRPYLRWLRLQRATGALAGGRTITQAAYIAGFADAAHLTRTFRRMLGTTPRELIRRASDTRELRLSSS
jgi:AraC-like DNA-binding protein